MNKKMREILAKIQEKTAQAKALMEGENKDIAKANAIMDEVDALQNELAAEKRVYDAEKTAGAQSANTPVADHAQEKNVAPLTGEQVVAKEVRAIMSPTRFANDKSLQESVDADGGYIVPEDIQTRINRWPEAEYSFLSDISEEIVSTNKGARTYQVTADTDAFVDLDENGAITKEITAPTFERVTFNIQDRAGFMPVSNDLVEDSDANISDVIVAWLAKANIATANAKVKAIIADHKNSGESTKGAKAITGGIDGIKKIVNVTLGQAYKGTAKIITNDDGLQYLDTLKDTNGRYLLNPDPTDSAKLTLRCGSVVVPVKVIPNAVLKTDVKTGNGAYTRVPFIIGDLQQGIKRYNRKSMTLKASDVATLGSFNAFAMNMTLIRAILRDDYKELDAKAYFNGYIDTTVTAATEPAENPSGNS